MVALFPIAAILLPTSWRQGKPGVLRHQGGSPLLSRLRGGRTPCNSRLYASRRYGAQPDALSVQLSDRELPKASSSARFVLRSVAVNPHATTAASPLQSFEIPPVEKPRTPAAVDVAFAGEGRALVVPHKCLRCEAPLLSMRTAMRCAVCGAEWPIRKRSAVLFVGQVLWRNQPDRDAGADPVRVADHLAHSDSRPSRRTTRSSTTTPPT
jgi:hypothetical protein